MLIIKKSSPKQKKKKKRVPYLTTISMDTKDTLVPHGFVVERSVAAPYSLDAHRYRITRTLHLRTWIVNYERSCPRMTYITSGLQERASASSWRCSSAPLCPFVEGNGERVVKKGSTVTTSFARQNSRGPCLGYDMKAVRKKEGERWGDQNRRNKFE